MADFHVHFYTNLDEAQRYVWALNELPWRGPVPSVGHDIEFDMSNGKLFRLRVVSVTWVPKSSTVGVELHMSQHGMSIREWIDWFKEHSR